MVDLLFGFFAWYWSSNTAFIITAILVIPLVVWEVVKRMPQRRVKSKKRRVKK